MSRVMLRNSERQAFKTCRWRWDWTYNRGLQAATAPTALRFGDLIHQSLAPYYKRGVKRGPHPAETFERLYMEQAKELDGQGFNVFADDKWEPALELGIGMLNGYVGRYAEEDKEYEVISSEQTFQLRVRSRPFRPYGGAPKEPLTFYVVGTFDGVWRHRSTGRIVFKEFKTAAAINVDGLAMDEQAGMYWTYGPKWLRMQRVLKDGELPSAILYTFLRKAIPNPDKRRDAEGRVLNKDGSVSKSQPAPYFERLPVYRDEADRERMHERVLDEIEEIVHARNGLHAIIKNPGPLHMPNCRDCAVREACEVHETGGDWEPVLSAAMIPWDAYAAHELPERH